MNVSSAFKIKGDLTGKKVLFVVNEATFFVSHRLILAKALRARGALVEIAGLFDSDVKTILEEGFHFHPLRYLTRWGTNPFREVGAIIELFSLYRKVKPDLVHHVTIKPGLYGSIAARLAKIPAVVNAVSGLGFPFLSKGLLAQFRRALIKVLYRIAFAHINCKVIFQNPDDLVLFKENRLISSGTEIIIRGSGVDTNVFLPSREPGGDIVVLMAGRLLWDKGVEQFVRAASILKRSGVAARFVLVGRCVSNNPSGIPRSVIDKWITEGNVEILQHTDNMPSLFSRIDIVCLPSYREGLPKVLIEGASCGKPIVATDVAGCREIVKDGVNGFLVPVRNELALSTALQVLIEQPELRVQMGLAGRQLVLEGGFAEHEVIGRTLEVYEVLLQDFASDCGAGKRERLNMVERSSTAGKRAA